jgi:hypothetical protein
MLKRLISLIRPHADQDMCEKRVKNIMTRLKIVDFHFNWDRTSCFIDFQYQEQSYRMEHSIEKAKEKGVFGVKNGLDCLMELAHTLEDLCRIMERGTYKLEDWVAGMEVTTYEEETEESVDEYEEYEEYDDYNGYQRNSYGRNLIRMRT